MIALPAQRGVDPQPGPPTSGACCFTDGTCTDPITEPDCLAAGGAYQGDGTDCATTSCPVPCDPANPNDCCVASPTNTPGCNDPACCNSVCAIDPFCCQVEWDNICADEAAVDPNCNCGPEKLPKFSQPPTGEGEDVASNIDWIDMFPNVVVSDDFVSDGRPITGVRFWGSRLGEFQEPFCGDNIVNQPGEECDGTDDAACPGQCQPNCTCPPPGACAVINGGFETGDFTGWTAISNGLSEFCPWTVSSSPGGCWFPTAPLSGAFDAWNGFDGDAGLEYQLYQDVALPAGATITLTTAHRIQYDSLGIASTLPRELHISIRDTSNVVLSALYQEDVMINGAPATDLGWNVQSFDISAFAGQTVRIHFREFIPESFTGPGTIEYDDISLTCASPLGDVQVIELLPNSKKDSATSPTPINTADLSFDELRARYLEMRDAALAGGDRKTLWQSVGRDRPFAGAPSTRTHCQTSPVVDAFGDAVDMSGFGPPLLDIDTVTVSTDGVNLFVTMTFHTPISPPSSGAANGVVGAVEFDTDQDAATGIPPLQNSFAPPFAALALGIDFLVDLFSEAGNPGFVDVIDVNIGVVGSVPIAYGPTSFSVTIPLGMLGGGSGIVDFSATIGTFNQPTDAMDVCGSSNTVPTGTDPDGWFISFHEPKRVGEEPRPPLALYFCDELVVQKMPTPLPACDGHPVIEYEVQLEDCCLVHAEIDSRTGEIPALKDAFYEEKCLDYAIDIQAVVGAKFIQDPDTLECLKMPTGNSADGDFWGWHTTHFECGIGSPIPLQQALQTIVTMGPGGIWLYGPWNPVQTVCSPPNMAFELLTTQPPVSPDLDGNCIPDQCEGLVPCPTCPADVNGDGVVDGLDIQAFVNCLLAGPAIAAGCECADMNADNAVDLNDVADFVIRLLTKLPCP